MCQTPLVSSCDPSDLFLTGDLYVVLVAHFASGAEPHPRKQKAPYLYHSYFSFNLKGSWNWSVVTMNRHLKKLGDEVYIGNWDWREMRVSWILGIPVEGLFVAPLLAPHKTICLLRPEIRAGRDLASVIWCSSLTQCIFFDILESFA